MVFPSFLIPQVHNKFVGKHSFSVQRAKLNEQSAHNIDVHLTCSSQLCLTPDGRSIPTSTGNGRE